MRATVVVVVWPVYWREMAGLSILRIKMDLFDWNHRISIGYFQDANYLRFRFVLHKQSSLPSNRRRAALAGHGSCWAKAPI